MRVRPIISSLVVALGLVLALAPAAAAAPSHAWTQQFGTAYDDQAQGVAVDRVGNIIVVGETQGSLDGLEFGGHADAFVRKYRPNGRLVWSRQFGSDEYDTAWDVAVDRTGDVIVVGHTDGSIDGAPHLGATDAFVRRYGASGRLQWHRQFGTADGDWARGVAVSPKGIIVVGGATTGAIGNTPLIGHADAFVYTFGPRGGRSWVRQFGTEAIDAVTSVAVDGRGRIALSGYTYGAFPGSTAQGQDDAFVRTYGARGGLGWTRQFGTASLDVALDVAFGRRGRVIVAGETHGTLGATEKIGADAFVRTYGRKGGLGWTQQFGTAGDDLFMGLATDKYGGVYVTGSVRPFNGEEDAVVRKYRADGRPVWMRRFGAQRSGEVAFSVAVDHRRNVIVVGTTTGRLPQQTASGLTDAFVRKYRR